MLKKVINYTDFDGNERTEEAYFNMTKSELMEFSFDMPEEMTEAANSENVDIEKTGIKLAEKMGRSGIFNFVKDLVIRSYGKKSEDGRRFIKNAQQTEEFTQTLAFDNFLIELFKSDQSAADFVVSIIPPDIAANIPANVLKRAE